MTKDPSLVREAAEFLQRKAESMRRTTIASAAFEMNEAAEQLLAGNSESAESLLYNMLAKAPTRQERNDISRFLAHLAASKPNE